MELSHIAFGAGRPVVILHGMFGAARNWTTIGRRLGETCRVLAVDLRNHGDSPWADEMDYGAMADDVRDFIVRHGLERPVVIGHSMGGKVAMVLALQHGASLAGLIVVDTAPAPYRTSAASYADILRAIDLSAVSRRAEIDAALAGQVPEPEIRAFLLSNLVREGDGWRWRVNLDAIAAGLGEIAGFPDIAGDRAHDGPTLFLSGGESAYLRPSHHARIRALFPNARFVAIPGAGHWVQADRPDAFLDAVRDFLDGIAA